MDPVLCSICNEILCYTNEICVVQDKNNRHICIKDGSQLGSMQRVPSSDPQNPNPSTPQVQFELLCRFGHFVGSQVPDMESRGAKSSLFLDGKHTKIINSKSFGKSLLYLLDWKQLVVPECRLSVSSARSRNSDNNTTYPHNPIDQNSSARFISFSRKVLPDSMTIRAGKDLQCSLPIVESQAATSKFPASGMYARLKLSFNNEVKVIRFGKDDNLQHLKKIISDTFSKIKEVSLLEKTEDHLRITYEDDDGDVISIENDQDLHLALDGVNTITRLLVSLKHDEFKLKAFVLGNDNTVGPGKSVVMCRNFSKTGYCRYGAECRFSHRPNKDGDGSSQTNPQDSKSAFMTGRQIETWLRRHLRMRASDNIEELSSNDGLQKAYFIVEQRHLKSELKDLLVKLLVKDEIRNSLLRHKTNKIYGMLIGSQFLLELHVRIQDLERPTAEYIRPYVLLAEELQLRTENGWKEAPLDSLKAVIDELPETPVKEELKVTVGRLLEQRERMKLLRAIAQPEKDFEGRNFRDVSIIPSKEELFSPFQLVPVNRIGIKYVSGHQYLDTHFHLLREDFVDGLRQGIKEYQRFKNPCPDIRLYSDVRLVGMSCGSSGISYRISLSIDKAKQIDWDSTKHLMFGSLLCITPDEFNNFLWATVSCREKSLLSRGEIDVQMVGDYETKLETTKSYILVESSVAYFEAYSHVLKVLQNTEMEHLPFCEHLISLEPKVEVPSYLISRPGKDVFNLECAFPEIKEELGRSSLSLLQDWPEWNSHLDESQKLAVKFGLTKKLALIQGPPGTGKTFVGLLIVKILLANLRKKSVVPNRHSEGSRSDQLKRASENATSEDYTCGPILVVCYTNHALDQFLEGIFVGEASLIRVGGRSKSEMLQRRSLQELIQAQKAGRGLYWSHSHASFEARKSRANLEQEILGCIEILKSEHVTRELLHGVATEEQIESLFLDFEETKNSKIVQIWLRMQKRKDDSERCTPASTSREAAVSDEVDNNNPFEILREEIMDQAVSSDEPIESWIQEADAHNRVQGGKGGAMKMNYFSNQASVSGHAVHGPGGFEQDDNNEWIMEQTQRNATQHDVAEIGNVELLHNGDREDVPLHTFVDDADVWLMTRQQRKSLHSYWLTEIKDNAQTRLTKLSKDYEVACKVLQEVDKEIQLTLLRGARVIGMTTTAAARNHDILMSLQPEIVIVEEAAEILESHILACLTPATKHLILIGDHMQLRPSVAVYKLAVKHKLDVSLFERLVRSGIEHVTLRVQRRMRPSISNLISTLYPNLKDHSSVSLYEDIKGMKSNVFFLDHKAQEQDFGGSKTNVVEARLAVELCMYLLNQGCYNHSNITILSMYKGQLKEIRGYLSQRMKEHADCYVSLANESISENRIPRVSSVDDYQGEESDIIILSLVRSNEKIGKDGPGTIGFLKTSNRVCVALSRARKGLYVFGNADLLANRSPLWKNVIETLGKTSCIGRELILRCQNHPALETRISNLEDFKQVRDGGCSQACEYQLDCGHACPRRCHNAAHETIICPKACPKLHEGCNHRCWKLCHGGKECPPCMKVIPRKIPNCQHVQNLPCSIPFEDVICTHSCERLLRCGHPCPRPCGKPCATVCHKLVLKELPCKHSLRLRCCEDSNTYSCPVQCGKVLEHGCGHICKGTCGKCKQGTLHIPCMQRCNRDLPCGHQCKASCSAMCPPCVEVCRNRCCHSRCRRTCGELCQPCVEVCPWNCPHYSCELLCHETCVRPRCNEPCQLLLKKCGHNCLGLCGDPCPQKCRICDPKTLDVIMQMTLDEFEESDLFVELSDCGHLFEVSGLDRWMDLDESVEDNDATATAIVLKKCPQCNTPIRRSQRYANVVKRRLGQLEEVKKKMYGYDRIEQGNEMMEQNDHAGACVCYLDAIMKSPGLLEAHYSLGCALCRLSKFSEAVSHLQLVVQNSPFAQILSALPNSSLNTNYCPPVNKQTFQQIKSKATYPLSIKAMVQLASALTNLYFFAAAVQVCDHVLKEDPKNMDALQIQDNARKGTYSQVMQEIQKGIGGGGHWYQCPNGHIYVVGECGMPMQTSRCPDCNTMIGGTNHTPAQGNTSYDQLY